MSVVSDPGNVMLKRLGGAGAGWAALVVVVGATQSWDIVWLPAIVGVVAAVYVMGQRVDVPFRGDPTNLLVTYRPWPSVVFGKIAAGAVFVGGCLANVLYPSGPSVLAWGAALFLVVRQLRKVSPSSQPVKRFVMKRLGAELTAQTSELRTPEMDARDRFSEVVFHQAGLVWRSPETKEVAVPTFAPPGLDQNGRPVVAVRMLEGVQTLDTWEKAATRLASAWRVLRVDVEGGRNDLGELVSGIVVLRAVVREFVRDEPVRWRQNIAQHDSGSNVVEYVSNLPMGELANSPEPWVLSLKEANLVVGGVPGAGKSVFLNGLLAHLSLHPHIEMAFIDLKAGVEAGAWEGRLSAAAYEQKAAATLIAWMLADCRSRYTRMKAAKVRNAWTAPGYLGAEEPVRVLVIDEAAELFAGASKESRQIADEATENLRSLVSLGRAAGYVVVMATQKPTVNTLPSAIRDIATVRIAFRCKTLPAAASIMGDDISEAVTDLNPTSISESQRGVAVATTRTGDLVRVQCSLIDDATIDIAAASRWPRALWPVDTGVDLSGEGSAQPADEAQASSVSMHKEGVERGKGAEDVWAELIDGAEESESDDLSPLPPTLKAVERRGVGLSMFDEPVAERNGGDDEPPPWRSAPPPLPRLPRSDK